MSERTSLQLEAQQVALVKAADRALGTGAATVVDLVMDNTLG